MLIQLVHDGWNHRCLIFDPSDPGGKDNKCSVWREAQRVVSPRPTSLNSEQWG